MGDDAVGDFVGDGCGAGAAGVIGGFHGGWGVVGLGAAGGVLAEVGVGFGAEVEEAIVEDGLLHAFHEAEVAVDVVEGEEAVAEHFGGVEEVADVGARVSGAARAGAAGFDGEGGGFPGAGFDGVWAVVGEG